ncbi:hypothetical protein Gasu2_43440 [Galdieria sulphuraria]|uniref:DUF202 domain-containing protein n=1 Tax=Galdieria sulphuraria TaxID=130081 RepID=M2XVP5_GALSU|nr:uncharacterized protein Gasu_47110 [Galdieria sulphuraria]EME27723.1 hypothetical protein Gasu_47110 [Galdieria sulphuraria]GJD10134.1 hypothetical protein Gasu2_43440 [Galdieria sulphuraria]|eukprot:XP_005704243.1 hypothetical protein Gasu_47110 [Galdieria sulphuraria]
MEEEQNTAKGTSSSGNTKGVVEGETTLANQLTFNQSQETVSTVSNAGNQADERTETRGGAPNTKEPSQSAEPVQNNLSTKSTANPSEGKSTQPTPPVVNPLDHHANERTFNSWQRTSAAYLVIGIALAKFFKGLTAIAGFIFFLIGCVIVVFAALRFESKRRHIDKFEYPAETVGPWIVTLCTVGVGVLSLAALWLGGKPAFIKNGRLFF